MKKIFGIVILLVAFSCGGFLLETLKENDSTPYTYIEYDEIANIVSGNTNTYIIFSSESCVTCRKLKNDIVSLRKEGRLDTKQTIYCVLVNEDNQDDIFKKYEIAGVPAIIEYEKSDYSNMLYKDITKDDVESFMS